MSFTKTTTRALAASITIVAAGATVAGAAVFHLPILGFSRTEVVAAAAPASSSARPVVLTARRTVEPKVVIKTRYVDDIVHRPARAHAPQGAMAAPSLVSSSSPRPAMASAATTSSPARTQPPSAAASGGHEHEDDGSQSVSTHEHDAEDSGDMSAPVEDQ